MEVQLQDIIDKIKREGLDTAQQEAQALKTAAEKNAQAVLAKAQADAEEIKSKARQDALRFEESAKAAISQAARDLTLSVKKSLEDLFAKLATESVKASYNQAVVEEAILSLVKNWAAFPQGAQIQVDESLKAKLFDALKGKLKDAAAKQVSVVASPSVTLGFRIQDGGAYYDFTAETIAKALASYVNPAIAQILKNEG